MPGLLLRYAVFLLAILMLVPRLAYSQAPSREPDDVAGLVRGALWNMALAKIRYEQAQAELAIYEKLLASITRIQQVENCFALHFPAFAEYPATS